MGDSDRVLSGVRHSATRSGRNALLVGIGIFLSRVAGFVRERVFAYYLGNSDAADIFRAALRIPNFLQNLFGEGVLSASFIPVYSGLLAKGEQRQASRLAVVIGLSLLALSVSLVAVGMLFAAELTTLIAPGFSGDKHRLAVQLVRIFFPGLGLLVLSAWCLGILNSHRSFFLSYAAPVLWNVAIIVALCLGYQLAAAAPTADLSIEYQIAVVAAWGVLVGSLFQLAIQLPWVWRYLTGAKGGTGSFVSLRSTFASSSFRTVYRNFVPVVFGRGVVQLSAYVDSVLASLLPTGAVAALGYAQTIYLLPISLFGMSVAVAELPEMSATATACSDPGGKLRERLAGSLRRVSFFILPSAVAFILLGDRVVAALYQTGRFSAEDTRYVWTILAAAALGMLPSALGRSFAAVFYAQGDTRTPLRVAVYRVTLASILAVVLSLKLPGWVGIESRWGVVCLTFASAVGSWFELVMYRSLLVRSVGVVSIEVGYLFKLAVVSVLAALMARFVGEYFSELYSPVLGGIVLAVFGVCYLGLCFPAKISERSMVVSVLRRFR